MAQKDFGALLARGESELPHKPRAIATAAGRDQFALDRPFLRDEGARHGRSAFRADRPLDELDSVLDEEVESRHVLVGEHAHQVAVAVACVRRVEAYPIMKHLVRRILDAGLLLQRVAAAEMDTSAAQDATTADVVILVDHDDRSTVVSRRNRRRQSRDAGADDDYIR